MQQLPKGYYAVQTDFTNAPKDQFFFQGVTYSVCAGENLFATIEDAAEHANDTPQTVLKGLPYESFVTPVLLFSGGKHNIDGYMFTKSLTLLGTGAGVNPNLTSADLEGFDMVCKTAPAITIAADDYIINKPEGFITHTADSHKVIGFDTADFSALDAYYNGTKAYYGDLHVHTDSGGTSDGKLPMAKWPSQMDEKRLDFAAVLDHRQMRGFFLPEWDEEKFIIGTEPGTSIINNEGDSPKRRGVHYNMLFPHKYSLAMVLANFPEYNFQGDELTGSFSYPKFTEDRFFELTRYVQSIGGIMVHSHPKSLLVSDNPLDYYFGEYTFIETLYESPSTQASFQNYDLWVALLALGKRVYASGGSDTHSDVSCDVVATFYTREKSGNAFFEQMSSADFTTGAFGIKMCIGDKPMGSEVKYTEGMTLTLRVDDLFPPAQKDDTVYEIRIYTDKGLAYSSSFNGKKPQAISLEVQKREFYRAEIYDLTHDYRIAIGNPIWLD